MHTPLSLKSSTVDARSVPLFHVVVFRNKLVEETGDAAKRRLLRQKEITDRIRKIVDAGEFENSCETLCECLGEEPGFYMFFGHLFPLIDKYEDGEGGVIERELCDCYCFLMLQPSYLEKLPLKGSPFDTGGVFNHKDPSDPKSCLGEHVLEIFVKDEGKYADCGQYVNEHTAEGFQDVLAYASAYIESYFTSADRYLERMFQKSDIEVTIDELTLKKDADSRNISFEIRCFSAVPLPSVAKNADTPPENVFVIAEAIQKVGNFPRNLWGQFNFRTEKSPLVYAYRESVKRIQSNSPEQP